MRVLLRLKVTGHVVLLLQQTSGFLPANNNEPMISREYRNSALGCICVDCARVTDCAAYNFVEEKHEQPHMTENPKFTPRDGSPTIEVNIRTIRNEDERKAEAERMWKEYKEEEAKAEANQESGGSLKGFEIYDFSPTTIYEYDVVKCADFVEDVGCWVRNMPEAIRLANPNFVPS